MQESRWWSVVVVGASAALATLLALSTPALWQLNLGLGAIGVYIAFWFAIAARAETATRTSSIVVVVTIAFAAAVTLASPIAAFVQAVAFPLIWTRLEDTRRSIVASFTLAIAVGVAMYFSAGADGEAAISALVSESLSIVFAVVFGLWISSIERRSTDRQRLIDDLTATQHEVSLLSQHAGVTSERERLAREIHDTIAQDLTGLVLLAQRARRDLSAGDTTAASEQLAVLEDGARAALAETRALVASTASTELDTGGIAAALERLGQRYDRETDLTVTVRVDAAPAIPRDLEVVLLRCAQEALANVRKHAAASTVTLTLAGTTLSVTDDGHGFDPAAASSGFGLSGMRERLALVGGTLDLASNAAGTTLTVTVAE